ncbi:MAG: hypothetical protein ACRC3Y_01045 [Romboutsia sp.]|uniref:hypothetical protein n=1 Tax=Romboutsia sp. TaxID=1965302 RepID=UPI003F2A7C3F
MCLYTYNNKFQTNTILNNEEYELLSQIYESIEADDNENTQKLTQQLISIQSSKENIEILQDGINLLK